MIIVQTEIEELTRDAAVVAEVDIEIGDEAIGRIEIGLYGKTVPKTVFPR